MTKHWGKKEPRGCGCRDQSHHTRIWRPDVCVKEKHNSILFTPLLCCLCYPQPLLLPPPGKMLGRKSVNLIRSVLKRIDRKKETSSDKRGNTGDDRYDRGEVIWWRLYPVIFRCNEKAGQEQCRWPRAWASYSSKWIKCDLVRITKTLGLQTKRERQIKGEVGGKDGGKFKKYGKHYCILRKIIIYQALTLSREQGSHSLSVAQYNPRSNPTNPYYDRSG